MRLLSGTSGFSYKEWKGAFYPEGLSATEMLRFYAERLPAVEINNTFYRLPRESVLEGWASQVGEGFRFALKASRRITHFKRLKEAEEETGYMLRTASVLGERLGAVLYQLPPNLKQDIERLDSFLAGLADPGRSAFEFRHESWFDETTYDCLRSYGAALCVADTDDADGQIISTALWGYVRLRKEAYADDTLTTWADRIRSAGWDRAFVFFKHEDDAAGPHMAQRFLQL